MKHTPLKFVALLGLLCVPLSVCRAELRAALFCEPDMRERGAVQVSLILSNPDEKPLFVATSALGPIVSYSDEKILLHFHVEARRLADRSYQVLSSAELRITELRKGESVVIRSLVREVQADEKKKIAALYDIGREFGERYGIWSGRLEVSLKEVGSPFLLDRQSGPNQTLEPTPLLGTSAAEQPLVPSRVVAHL